MLQVYTARTSYMGNKPTLDISAHSPEIWIRPDDIIWEWLKVRVVTEEHFKKLYLKQLEESVKTNARQWLELLEQDEVVITDTSKYGTFCPRQVLAVILVSFGANYCGEIVR